jgi:esterase
MKLNFVEQGIGAPVILVHGMFGSLSNLGNLARCLSADYRVISVDLRNHGDSPHTLAMDLQSMALDIVELMDDLAISSAHLVGHSLGGKVAMQLAMNSSQRVTSLVVVDIAPVNYREKNTNIINSLKNLSNVNIEDRKSADQVLANQGIDAPIRAFLLKNLRRNAQGQFQLKLNVNSIATNYEDRLVRAPEGDNYLGPSLFLKGQNSTYIEESHIAIIASLFPNSSLQVVEEAGHWLHAEKPDQFNHLVSTFIGENS